MRILREWNSGHTGWCSRTDRQTDRWTVTQTVNCQKLQTQCPGALSYKRWLLTYYFEENNVQDYHTKEQQAGKTNCCLHDVFWFWFGPKVFPKASVNICVIISSILCIAQKRQLQHIWATNEEAPLPIGNKHFYPSIGVKNSFENSTTIIIMFENENMQKNYFVPSGLTFIRKTLL